jgi:D-threo-aldose 1-dehydrogenase
LRRRVIDLSPLSLGGAPLGNMYTPVSEEDARATVDAAWERGIRFFDTAPHYGLGLSERRFGAALRERPRHEYVLSTKVGRILEPVDNRAEFDSEGGFAVPARWRRMWNFTREGVRRSLADSLQRLGLDRVDIVFIHDPDDHRREAFEQAYPALEELRSEGVVRAIGAGMNQSAMLTDFVRETDVDVLLLAGRYTLLEQDALDDLLPAAEARGVKIVAGGVFNSGLLAQARPPKDATYDYRKAPADLLSTARRLATVCERHGVSLPAAALAFPARHPAVASVLTGARSAEQIERNADLFATAVPDDLWTELKAEGLLRADAPT